MSKLSKVSCRSRQQWWLKQSVSMLEYAFLFSVSPFLIQSEDTVLLQANEKNIEANSL